MSKLNAVLKRHTYTDKQVLGKLTLYEDTKMIFECDTLELPWLNNENRVSCIPTGSYDCVVRSSQKYPLSYHVKTKGEAQVNGRSWILIHPGNFFSDILGCIIVGETLMDINKDGYKDLVSSKKALKRLFEATKSKNFSLEIEGSQPTIGRVKKVGNEFPDLMPSIGQVVIVRSDTLNIRESNSTQAKIFKVANRGDEFRVIRVKGKWIFVEYEKTLMGWLHGDYVRRSINL